METPIHEDGSSQANAADPLAPDQTPDENRETVHDARNAIYEQADEANTTARREENAAEGHDIQGDQAPAEDGLDGFRGDPDYVPDPRTRGQQEQREQQAQAIKEGVQKVEPMHEPELDPEPKQVPDEYADDPLYEFLAMDENDQVVFRTKVNGEEKLIPIDKARDELQKHEAANDRLRQAAEQQKVLNARAADLATREQALQNTMQQLHTSQQQTPQAPPAQDALTDEELAAEAKSVVAGLFTGTEEDAAARLTNLLKKARGAPATPIDPKQIVDQAATIAEQRYEERENRKDGLAGIAKFKKDYSDIFNDPALFKHADSLTDTIRAENPDWKPSQVMLEAGKQTREWVQSLRGESPETTSEQPEPDDRQERKRQLRPLPQFRSGHQTGEPAPNPETPHDIVSEIRQSRGQAVA